MAPAGGRLGPVEPVRDVPNGRERHCHTILGHANGSSAPGRLFCEPARIANEALSARPNPQNGGDAR